MKRRLLIIVCAVALVIGVWLFISTDGHSINIETAGQIKIGMTETELETILGVKAGTYKTGLVGVDTDWPEVKKASLLSAIRECTGKPVEDHNLKEWCSDSVWIGAYFDKEGKVAHLGYCNMAPESEGFWPRIRRWLNL